MAKLPGNEQLRSFGGRKLFSLRDVNRLPVPEKEEIYARLLPERLLELLHIDRRTLTNECGDRLVSFIAPEGLGLLRIDVRHEPQGQDPVFFVELADTQFHQMELSFCIVNDPASPRFDVDVDRHGRDNWFATLGRNVTEEVRAMEAGLFPNQVRRGLRLFGEFFPLLEQFVDSLGIDMILAEPLTYDNAIRYEKYGFDYLTGKLLMQRIDESFHDGELLRRLDGSTPFRRPGMDLTVRGRSWAIHDGIMDEPWEDVRIYRMVGVDAAVDTFPDRQSEG